MANYPFWSQQIVILMFAFFGGNKTKEDN